MGSRRLASDRSRVHQGNEGVRHDGLSRQSVQAARRPDPLEVLAQTASRLAAIVRAHSVTVLRTRPFEDKWTPNEIIGHLVDGEWVYGYRLRLIVSEDNPAILGTNQDLWVARQLHNEREPSELVDMFRATARVQSGVVETSVPGGLESYRPAQRARSRVPGRDVAHVGRSRPLAPRPDRSLRSSRA